MNNIKSNPGYCPICEKPTIFYEYGEWLRDYYICGSCMSIPRQRALINSLNIFVPNWHNIVVHESSPGGKSSDYIKSKCTNYTESQYFENIEYGNYVSGVRCENLECLTFTDNSLDLFITQDVFEHIFNPEKAFKEIQRVLKPNGYHVFTMPWYSDRKTKKRAKFENGEIKYIEESVYHGNPIDDNGSLVVFDWGSDFVDFINKSSKMQTTVYLQKDRSMGLDGEFLHVFISKKIV